MVDYKLIHDFLMKYGSKIKAADSEKEDHGVLSPVRHLGTESESVQYLKTGIETKAEYVLLSLNESGIISKGKSLYVNGGCYRVVYTDHFYYANKPLYQRAYLHKERVK